MNIYEILRIIEEILPSDTAMEGDRLGLQVHSGQANIDSILVTMELNNQVIDEAVSKKTNCIVTFHPLIFKPLISIIDNDRVGMLSSKLIKNSISLISIHTNFDAFINGTSKILADKLGFEVSNFLVPDPKYKDRGMGVICNLDIPILANDLIKLVSDKLNAHIRFNIGKNHTIKKIAIVAGSGSSFIDQALDINADALITADITYHSFHRTNEKMMLIDPGHYEMEQFVSLGLADLLKSKMNQLSFYISNVHTNPINYYPDSENLIRKQKDYLINKYNMV